MDPKRGLPGVVKLLLALGTVGTIATGVAFVAGVLGGWATVRDTRRREAETAQRSAAEEADHQAAQAELEVLQAAKTPLDERRRRLAAIEALAKRSTAPLGVSLCVARGDVRLREAEDAQAATVRAAASVLAPATWKTRAEGERRHQLVADALAAVAVTQGVLDGYGADFDACVRTVPSNELAIVAFHNAADPRLAAGRAATEATREVLAETDRLVGVMDKHFGRWSYVARSKQIQFATNAGLADYQAGIAALNRAADRERSLHEAWAKSGEE